MAREPSDRGAPSRARPRVLDLIAYGLLAAALLLGGCAAASVSKTRLPEKLDPPPLRKPIVLLANGDGFFVSQDAKITGGLAELWAMTPADAVALQVYIRQLRAEYEWLRKHPAFEE